MPTFALYVIHMLRLLKAIGVRFELFLSIFSGIFISLLILTILMITKSKQVIRVSLEENLKLEVNTVVEMLRREHNLKLENAKNDLKVADYLFSSSPLQISNEKYLMKVRDQLTNETDEVVLHYWELDGRNLKENHDFVDQIKKMTGSTVTIFQKTSVGYIRISTNVPDEKGIRATGTYLSPNSPVVRQIEKKANYYGRAFVVNDWYITAYQPIIKNGDIIGMLYVGKKEKDIDELRKSIMNLKIGKTGYVVVFDNEGHLVVHNAGNEPDIPDYGDIYRLLKKDHGLIQYNPPDSKSNKIIAYKKFAPYTFQVAAIIDQREESKNLVQSVIIFSIAIALFFIILLSVIMFRLTSKRLHIYLKKLQEADNRLEQVTTALSESEKEFETLFNNTNDHIFVIDFDGKFIRVNATACRILGYTHTELLKKRFTDIKTPKYVNSVRENLDKIRLLRTFQYESEHVTKDGRVIPVEMSSRCIQFHGRDVILTIARDITERKKVEQQLVTTIIETEEKERKRFAADLHDVLAPILTTIKLFTDLLKKGDQKKISNEEIVANIEELVDQSIITTKEISNNIRPNVLQDFGLATAIRDFCSYISKTKSIKINLVTTNYSITKRGLEETILYQTLKELINNTLKHAQAQTITIDLKSYHNQIILYYRDDGIGFDHELAIKEKSGLGLNNIFNKIKTIKGNIDFNSSTGNGMFVLITATVTETN